MTLKDFPAVEAFEECFVNNADLDRISGYLGRFNPIRVMRMESMEIRHSAILAWLLDPIETHGFDDKFLRAFLSQALRGQDGKHRPTALDVSQADLRDAEIRREKQNVDLFVVCPSNGWAFTIENKFHSKQHSGQLQRYFDHAVEEAKLSKLEFKHCGIFLTLHEEDPDVQARESYVTLRYSAICAILDTLLNRRDANIAVEVRHFLNHYLDIIEDAAGMNDAQKEMEALAKELYRSHKKVLDFVMEHGKTTEFSLAAESVFKGDFDYGKEVSVGNVRFMFSHINDRLFSFLPVTWRDHLGGEDKKSAWVGCENWWARYPLICWFQLFEGQDGVEGSLRMFAEVGPLANPEHRVKLINGIKASAENADADEVHFGANAVMPGARYSKFLKSSANTVRIVDVSNSEAIEEGIRTLLKKFLPTFEAVSESLPKFMEFVEGYNSV